MSSSLASERATVQNPLITYAVAGISEDSLRHSTKDSLPQRVLPALIGDRAAGLRFGNVIIHLIALSLYGLGFIQAPPLLHRLKRLD